MKLYIQEKFFTMKQIRWQLSIIQIIFDGLKKQEFILWTWRAIPHVEFEENAGLMIPVVSVDVHYKTPARFGDTVNIHVWISSFNGIRLKCAYRVENAATGEILCTGESEHCFVDQTFKPVSLRKSYPDYYAAFSAHVKEGRA